MDSISLQVRTGVPTGPRLTVPEACNQSPRFKSAGDQEVQQLFDELQTTKEIGDVWKRYQ